MPSEKDKSKEQKAAESEVESFRKDLGPFVVAAETTRMAMVFTDAKESNHPLIFANDSFLQLAGYSRKEVLGQSVDFLLGPIFVMQSSPLISLSPFPSWPDYIINTCGNYFGKGSPLP